MATDDLVTTREALAAASQRYPAPLAHVAGELLYELSAARPNYMRCFLLEIDLFEISVAFFSFVQVAQLDRAGLRLTASEAAVTQLRDNPNLCTGHWWGLLRETSRDVRELPVELTSPLARELSALYFDPAGRAAKLSRVLDQVPGLRNRMKGHSWTLPAEQYETLALELLVTVSNYLSCLGCLESYVLFQCLACDPIGDAHRMDLAALNGDARRPRRHEVRAAGPFKQGFLYVARRDELFTGQIDATGSLCLHPFVQMRARDGRPEDLYLVQGLQRKHAELRGVVGSDGVSCAPSLDAARALLDGMLGRSTSTTGPFGKLREVIAGVTREAIASTQGRASYRSDAYYVRPRLVRQIEDSFASNQGVALLVAPSGMGKTALACYLADRWLVSTDDTVAVLLVFAPELAAAGESLTLWCRRRLGQSLEDLRTAATKSRSRVLVIVDGLERVRDPLALLDEMTEPSTSGTSGAPESLHFLVTLNESALSALLAGVRRAPRRPDPRVLIIPPLDAAEGRKVYDAFQIHEGAATSPPPTDLFETLSTPLLLRLAHASSHEGSGTALTSGHVLLSYTEEVVFSDLARSEIVHRLVDSIIERGERTVAVADLAEDPWMRTALLSSAPDSPLDALFREGILFLTRLSHESQLPLPGEAHIGFTFDLLRDYVVFTRLVRRFGGATDALARLAGSATASSPLIGGLRFLVLERLRDPRVTEPPADLVEFLALLDDAPRRALLDELFAAPVDVGRAQPLHGLLRAVFGRFDPRARETFLDGARTAFDRLERRGQIAAAGAVCGLAVELGLAAYPAHVLPIMFDWSRAQLRNVSVTASLETARAALTAAEGLQDPSFRVEASTCVAHALLTQGSYGAGTDIVRALVEQDPKSLSPAAEFALRMSETRVRRDAAGLARARELAAEHHQPRWLALARLAEVRPLVADGHVRLKSATLALAEETMSCAKHSGYAALEARAYEAMAAYWRDDAARELSCVEAGLEAASAARDISARASLLGRLATWSLRVGRFGDAQRIGTEAAGLFDDLGYRYRHLKLRQHVLATCEVELGKPGTALALWREILVGLRDMGRFREAGLSALLVAEMLTDVGKPDAARAMLTEARELEGLTRSAPRLNFDMVTGRALELEGDVDAALERFGKARAWGVAGKFADYVFQPGLLAIRLLLERKDESKADLDRAHETLHELLEDRSTDPAQRERYDGEICLLYCRLHVEREALAEARVWLDKANLWFAANPAQRGAVECKAMNLVFEWITANALEAPATDEPSKKGASAASKRASGLRSSVRQRLRGEVFDVVEAMAATFEDPEEASGFLAHHPVIRLLKRHGMEAEQT